MSSTQPYLDLFLDNLENLSPELTRNFHLIKEIDLRVQTALIEIDKLKKEYIQNFKSYDVQTRAEKMKIIDRKYEKIKQFGDEKVQLANQTYELVDKHIRRLDTDLVRFEAELKERSIGRRSGEHEGLDNMDTSAHNLSTMSTASLGQDSKRKKKKVEQPAMIIEETESALPISSLALTLAQPADVLDMPVDPNEPTYCLCNQVSYGEMIGCDNFECPIEWFHFGCVGLTTKPKGKWYCQQCLEKRKKA
ncbi:unnamed protein product [Brachionus calyciflorus]|uniref:Inhibitor of growth protein n=1 Tax=Brachionus calyciflorus TaxID=104777 RepID=A0A813MLR3_9BILA|nr:unnamed protein product [Brachionus calyciflorus]